MTIWQDLEANASIGATDHRVGLGAKARAFLTLRFQATLLFRISQSCGRKSTFAGGLVKQFNQLVTGADIAWQADGATHSGAVPSPEMGSQVLVGAGARIIGAVKIHDRCSVGANAVVTKSSDGPGLVAVGIPAVWRERRV